MVANDVLFARFIRSLHEESTLALGCCIADSKPMCP